MRLNPDCIRDILFTVEEQTGFSTVMRYPDNYERLKSYDSEEVLYHIRQCQLSGLLTKIEFFMGGACLIYDLSPAGHAFLADIRSDTNWAKTKEIAKKVGSFSLDALTKIAVNVVAEAIKRHF